jgi:hypothetical protein
MPAYIIRLAFCHSLPGGINPHSLHFILAIYKGANMRIDQVTKGSLRDEPFFMIIVAYFNDMV